jgi:hypothetical protein
MKAAQPRVAAFAPQAARRRTQSLAGEAWAAELNRELEVLFEHFSTWADNGLSAFDLSGLIHAFHNGICRDLYARCTTLPPTITVSRAVALRILGEGDLGVKLLRKLASEIEGYR